MRPGELLGYFSIFDLAFGPTVQDCGNPGTGCRAVRTAATSMLE